MLNVFVLSFRTDKDYCSGPPPFYTRASIKTRIWKPFPNKMGDPQRVLFEQKVRLSWEIWSVRGCKNNHSWIFTELSASFEIIRRQWVMPKHVRAQRYFNKEKILAPSWYRMKRTDKRRYYIIISHATKCCETTALYLLDWSVFSLDLLHQRFSRKLLRAFHAREWREDKTSQRVGVCFCSRISRVPWWADYCHDHGNNMKIHERERKIKHDTEAPRAPWPVDRVPELNFSLTGQMRTRSRVKKRVWVSGVCVCSLRKFVEACVCSFDCIHARFIFRPSLRRRWTTKVHRQRRESWFKKIKPGKDETRTTELNERDRVIIFISFDK